MDNLTLIVFIFLCVSLSRVYKLNHEITSDEPNSNQMNYNTLIFGNLGSPKKLVNLTRASHSDSWKNLSLLVLIISGDIQVNPGPSIYPCGFCQCPVTWEHNRATACDQCSVWYHSACLEQCSVYVSLLQRDHVSWKCCGCDSMNIESFTDRSKAVLLLWIFYVFVLSCVCNVLCASVYMCFVVTCWERADLLALVCGVFCEFVTFPLVSWVRCGT